MPETAELKTLNDWMEKLKAATGRSQMLALVDQFRQLEWTDVERAQIAKLYIRLLDILPEEREAAVTGAGAQSGAAKGSGSGAAGSAGADSAQAGKESAAAAQAGADQGAALEDEEVWYEKM